MALSFQHRSLRSTLLGVEINSTAQFRGIPYGKVSERFHEAVAITVLPGELDCTRYGPRCPQVPIDVGHLLRIPSENPLPAEPEDEFGCLNLDIVLPKDCLANDSEKLPVLVWIHGGSQAMTFGSAASGVCDPTTIVRDSSNMGKPLVFVSVQYRLNIFAFGDGVGSKNLALQDQALALHWIQDHISGFGGDPERVTLAGESAGAVYCHAHLVTGAPARQYILSSGSLHLSPPQPKEKASALRQSVQAQFDGLELRTVSVAAMIEAVKRSKIQSWFLEEDLRFKNWQNTTGSAQGLLISDVQNEAVLWREGIMSTDTEAIVSAFDLAGESSTELKRLYSIDSGRPSSSKLGALDFINDYKFVLPAEKLVEQWRAEQKPVFRCIIDEANPWQPSNGAHHAVDLILLFGGFDLSLAPKAQQTGANMRKQWIEFVHEEEPWSQNVHTAFGPHGVFQELDDDELRSRRRMAQVEFLGRTDGAILDKVFFALAAGKLSLLN